MDSEDAMTIMSCLMLILNFIRADKQIPYVPPPTLDNPLSVLVGRC